MIGFVYRSHALGPLSKGVRFLPAKSIVAWFGERLALARKDAGVGNERKLGESKTIGAIWDELGGYVYGLSSIFKAARDHELAPPTTMAELKKLLTAVRPAIASHLDHAKRVRGMLGTEGASK